MKRIMLLVFALVIANLLFAQMAKDKPIPKGNFDSYEIECLDGKIRPYIVYVPETYDTSKSTLLIYLHGAVMRDSVSPNPLKSAQRSSMCKLAEAGGYALLFPYADKELNWFNDNGTKMIFDEIDFVIKQYSINPNKIFLSGFSDGASGTFYIAMNSPSRFGGFIALNGYLPVASQLGESQCYIDNMKNKPIYVVNTKGDLLYPSKETTPMIDFMKDRQIEVSYNTPEGNHFLSYLPDETKNIIDFIDGNPYKKNKSIEWEFNRTETSNISWISSMVLDTLQPHKAWYQNVNLTLVDSSVNFSIDYDREYRGTGLKVAGFRSDSSIAKQMGVLPGDIITMMEKDTVKSMYTPYFYYFNKRAGDSTQLSVIRNEETIVLNGRFESPHDFQITKHDLASGKVYANISDNIIDIKTSCISEVCIDFSKVPYDSSSEVSVILNGIQKAKRKFDLEEKVCFSD